MDDRRIRALQRRFQLTLEFNQFELVALGGTALIAASAARDGESNWLEGAQLLVVYVIIGLAFFFLPM